MWGSISVARVQLECLSSYCRGMYFSKGTGCHLDVFFGRFESWAQPERVVRGGRDCHDSPGCCCYMTTASLGVPAGPAEGGGKEGCLLLQETGGGRRVCPERAGCRHSHDLVGGNRDRTERALRSCNNYPSFLSHDAVTGCVRRSEANAERIRKVQSTRNNLEMKFWGLMWQTCVRPISRLLEQSPQLVSWNHGHFDRDLKLSVGDMQCNNFLWLDALKSATVWRFVFIHGTLFSLLFAHIDVYVEKGKHDIGSVSFRQNVHHFRCALEHVIWTLRMWYTSRSKSLATDCSSASIIL